MDATLEHERKLQAPDGFELPALGGSPLEPRVFTSVYYDVPNRSLTNAGITLRRRTERGKSVWQLKLPQADARLELEQPAVRWARRTSCGGCSTPIYVIRASRRSPSCVPGGAASSSSAPNRRQR